MQDDTRTQVHPSQRLYPTPPVHKPRLTSAGTNLVKLKPVGPKVENQFKNKQKKSKRKLEDSVGIILATKL